MGCDRGINSSNRTQDTLGSSTRSICERIDLLGSQQMIRVIRQGFVSDSLLYPYADLRWKSKSTNGERRFVVEGRLCVERLLSSTLDVESLLVQEGKESEVQRWSDRDVPVYVLPKSEICQLVGFDFHRGFLACAYRPPKMQIAALNWSEALRPVALAALGVSENENLGSMFRTAAALGVQDILLDKQSADPFARRTVRVSMGNVFKLRIYFLDHPAHQLRWMTTELGVRTIVTTLATDSTPISDLSYDDRPIVLVMGNEARGVDLEVASNASDQTHIPMELGTDSLNVGVATGICLHSIVSRL